MFFYNDNDDINNGELRRSCDLYCGRHAIVQSTIITIITDDTRAHMALQIHINSTDLLTARGVAHLVVHGTSGSTSYETIPPVRLETSGGVLSTVDMLVQRRDGRRRLRELDDYFSRKLLLVVTLLLCLHLS